MGKYFLELMQVHPYFVDKPSSLIAAVSMYMGIVIMKGKEWDINLQHYSGYNILELNNMCKILIQVIKQNNYTSIRKKYESSSNLKVSLMVYERIVKDADK